MPISQEANPTGTAESPFTTDISNLNATDIARFNGVHLGEDGIHRARLRVDNPKSEFNGMTKEFTLSELRSQHRALEASGVNNGFATAQLGQLQVAVMALEDLKLAGQFNSAARGVASTMSSTVVPSQPTPAFAPQP
jgi:hypothetical protein